MKLHIEGDINEYYVQTLCMIFYPGEKFTEEPTEGEPELTLTLTERDGGFFAAARLSQNGKETTAEKFLPAREDMTRDRLKKLAVGFAVLGAAGEMLRYHPSWGMLTGVRTSSISRVR